jgi:hypothetical protein
MGINRANGPNFNQIQPNNNQGMRHAGFRNDKFGPMCHCIARDMTMESTGEELMQVNEW